MLRIRVVALQGRRLQRSIAWGLGAATVLALIGGCVDRSRPSASDFMPSSNDVVTAYGMTLDENASPEQTVWVLLMAIRDDTRSKMNSPEWHEHIKLQCRLTNVEFLRRNANASLSISDEAIFALVHGWASALNYYVQRFDDDFESARVRMISRRIESDQLPEVGDDGQVVDYTVTGTGADSGVRIRFLLSRTQKGFWRAFKLILGPPPAPKS
jgi:hypothetical protein